MQSRYDAAPFLNFLFALENIHLHSCDFVEQFVNQLKTNLCVLPAFMYLSQR